MRLLCLATSVLAIHVAVAAGAQGKPLPPGQIVFNHWCAPCHSAGPGNPGTVALSVKYGSAKPAELERRTDLTPELVKYFVRQGFSVMAPFRKTEITDAELNDLASYMASSKDSSKKNR